MRDKIKRYQYICRIVFSSFCFTTVLVSITQSFGSVSAVEGSTSTNASVTVSSACSFGRTNGSGEYNGILANNSSVEIVGSTFTTFCNDPGGYAVYAIGYSNNEYGNTDLIYNNEPTSTNNIKTDGDTTENDSNNGNGSSWKMKLVPVENNFTPTIENNYSSYNNIPSTYTKVASYNNVTINNADSTTGSSITTHYQATASSTQPAGTYTGAVKYTMVHPGTTIAAYFMQDVADWADGLPNPGDTFQAVDRRDGKVYWVARLADGNIWMTQNLDLDIDETKTYTHYDTDLGWNDPNNLDVNATWQPTEGHSTVSLVNQNFSYSATEPYSADPGDIYYYPSNSDANDIQYNSLSECISAGHGDCTHYHAGNYYNWSAAAASNDTSNFVPGYTPSSICPSGWRLQKTSPNEYKELAEAYNISSSNALALRDKPIYLIRGGNFVNGNSYLSGKLSGGNYWLGVSSNIYSNYAMQLTFIKTRLNFANSVSRSSGFSLRCLARTED